MRTVELFCRAGGLSLGLRRAGCAVMLALDVWPEAVPVYRANLGGVTEVADLSNLMTVASAVAALRSDLIAGGPPCPDFSAAGQDIDGERVPLMIAFAMIVAVARPRWLLLENVPWAKDSAAWATARELQTQAGTA